jgi:AcrR family transcriptional regulator
VSAPAAQVRRAGPGRPPTGARDRILEAAFAVLASDGYAGLTTAKVADLAGQNKALISYHFGGKAGLVAEVARGVAGVITGATREAIADVEDPEELAAAIVTAVFATMDESEGIQRVYFDLISQSVVDPEVERIMSEMKARFRAVLHQRLGEIDPDRPPAELESAAVFLIAGTEGLALERLERGETPALAGARDLWVRAAGTALRA